MRTRTPKESRPSDEYMDAHPRRTGPRRNISMRAPEENGPKEEYARTPEEK